MRFSELLHSSTKGLYCPIGDFYIDPPTQVEKALITHGHSDHARSGHKHVLATQETLDIMAIRYGSDFAGSVQPIAYGESVIINGVRVAFYGAGHVLGSAQILVEYGGMRIVASGDYKRAYDPTCAPFEPVACDVFITEATFGLPVFTHPNARDEIAKLLSSLNQFTERTHIVGAYSLGKAQRVIKLIRQAGYDEPIYIHGSFKRLCNYYQSRGIDLGQLLPATADEPVSNVDFAGKIVIGPTSSLNDRWSRRFVDPLTCYASGWMRIRQRAKQSGVELPLIISDHCDWPELTRTITELNPEEVWVTHGREEALVRWCEMNNVVAKPLHLIGFDDEAE